MSPLTLVDLGKTRAIDQVVDRSGGGALAFLLYDVCITLDDEVDSIWVLPRHSWVKWLFLFTRYFAIALQVSNVCLVKIMGVQDRLAIFHIRGWYIAQASMTYVLLSVVQIIFMMRVYGLYGRNIWVAMIFVCLLLGETVTVVVGAYITFSYHLFILDMDKLTLPDTFTYLGFASIVCQLTTLILTFLWYLFARRAGMGEVPIVMMMMRDGTAAFIPIFVISVVTVMLTFLDSPYAAVGYVWLLSIISLAGCRLIINMQRFPANSKGNTTNTMQLTTMYQTSYDDIEVPG